MEPYPKVVFPHDINIDEAIEALHIAINYVERVREDMVYVCHCLAQPEWMPDTIGNTRAQWPDFVPERLANTGAQIAEAIDASLSENAVMGIVTDNFGVDAYFVLYDLLSGEKLIGGDLEVDHEVIVRTELEEDIIYAIEKGDRLNMSPSLVSEFFHYTEDKINEAIDTNVLMSRHYRIEWIGKMIETLEGMR